MLLARHVSRVSVISQSSDKDVVARSTAQVRKPHLMTVFMMLARVGPAAAVIEW